MTEWVCNLCENAECKQHDEEICYCTEIRGEVQGVYDCLRFSEDNYDRSEWFEHSLLYTVSLGDLIRMVEAKIQEVGDRLLRVGLVNPDSYRGYYKEVCFEPVHNVRLSRMLYHAKYAVGHVFYGYKGGEFRMNENCDVYIAYSDMSSCSTLCPLTLGSLLNDLVDDSLGGSR